MFQRLSIPFVALALLLVPMKVLGAPTPTQTPAPTTSSPAGATPTPAPTDPLSLELQAKLAQQAQLQATQQSLSAEIGAAQGQKAQLLTTIQAGHASIAAAELQITKYQAAYEAATALETKAKAAANAAEARASQDRALLAQYMTLRYQSNLNFTSFLLSSSSFSDLMNRSADLSRVVNSGDDLLARVKQDEATAVAAEQQAANDAASANAASQQLVLQNQQLQAQIATEQLLVTQLDSQSGSAAKEIAASDSQSAALAQQIAAIRLKELNQTMLDASQADWATAEYYLQHNLGNLPVGSPIDKQHPASVRFIWPVPGSEITQGFGPSPYPFEPAFAGFPHFHTGLDLAAPEGSPVYAPANGVVVAAISGNVGFGNHIIIAHDTYTMTLYGHLETMLVKPGDVVKQGQIIGLVGSTGNSTGPHCHFEVHISGSPVDPAPFLPPLPAGASGPPALH